MAGLLDALQSDDGLLGLALLSAGAAKPVRTSLGEGLLGGMQLVQQSRNAREDRAQRMRMQQMQEQALLAQLDERKRAMTEAERQAAERQRIQQVISGAFSPTQPIQANAASGIAGPRPEALGAVGQRRPVDFQQLVAQGVPPELAKNLAEAQNWGRPKVARTIEEMGPSGPTTVQFDDYGNRVGGGIAKPVQLQAQDLGGRVAQWNPFTGAMVGQGFQKSNSPDALLSAETARRGQNMTDARAREANSIQQTNGKIPPGYRLRADGNLEPIPGGPADIKAGELGAKAEQRKQLTISSANSVLDTVGDAKKLVGFSTAGLGSWTASLPATDARDLAAKLETIKANLGFDRLQQMREASPTGGALGAVAVQELTALQSTVASLDQGQSPAQLKQSLDKIERHYSNWLRAVGAPRSQQTPNSPQSSSGKVIDFSSLPGGN
jgi:hypothetical protein